VPVHAMKVYDAAVQIFSFLISALDRGEWLRSLSGHLITGKSDPGTHLIWGLVVARVSQDVLSHCTTRSFTSYSSPIIYDYQITGNVIRGTFTATYEEVEKREYIFAGHIW